MGSHQKSFEYRKASLEGKGREMVEQDLKVNHVL